MAIAQSLIMKPSILMMDEPFGALDPDTREQMRVLLLELWEAEQMTIFFVTHDLEEAAYLGTRVLVLSQYYTDDRAPPIRRGAKSSPTTSCRAPSARRMPSTAPSSCRWWRRSARDSTPRAAGMWPSST